MSSNKRRSREASRLLKRPARPTPEKGGSEGGSSLAHDVAGARTAGGTSPGKRTGLCPVCGKRRLDVTPKPPDIRTPSAPYWIGCWVCEAAGLKQEEYLAPLAEAVGTTMAELLKDPLRSLEPYLGESANGSGGLRPPPMPMPESITEGHVGGWRSRLLSEEEPLDYVRGERGLTLATIRRYQIGWDGDRETLTLPIRNGTGEIINLRRRRLGPEQPWRGLLGRPCSFFPALRSRRWFLLCEGEFDAMLSIQAGLPAVTTTCGATLPDSLASELAALGRPVAVAYDVGAEWAAERSAAKLRAAGCQAWVVRLGLPDEGADVSDWFLTYDRKRPELIGLIRRARERTA
jgi:hypothetical protein